VHGGWRVFYYVKSKIYPSKLSQNKLIKARKEVCHPATMDSLYFLNRARKWLIAPYKGEPREFFSDLK
jgi:hypothetical protein